MAELDAILDDVLIDEEEEEEVGTKDEVPAASSNLDDMLDAALDELDIGNTEFTAGGASVAGRPQQPVSGEGEGKREEDVDDDDLFDIPALSAADRIPDVLRSDIAMANGVAQRWAESIARDTEKMQATRQADPPAQGKTSRAYQELVGVRAGLREILKMDQSSASAQQNDDDLGEEGFDDDTNRAPPTLQLQTSVSTASVAERHWTQLLGGGLTSLKKLESVFDHLLRFSLSTCTSINAEEQERIKRLLLSNNRIRAVAARLYAQSLVDSTADTLAADPETAANVRLEQRLPHLREHVERRRRKPPP